MQTIHPEYVVDEKQQRKSIILPLSEWDLIMEELEELSDIRAYDTAKASSQSVLPFEMAVREIQAKYDA